MAFVRLGLESANVPHADRYGLLWLERGNLFVEKGTLRFLSAGSPNLEPGAYDIPYQTVSMLLLGPGTTVSHDVFRLAGSHGLGLVAIGEGGVRMYTAPPLSPDRSALARRQVTLWASSKGRLRTVLKMYELRFGEKLSTTNLEELRGIEGTRVRQSYKLLAERYGIPWRQRKFNRANPEKNDEINNAINHAATAAYAAASIAVAATATIPQLGFIHEAAYDAFGLDIADIFRMSVTIPIAFKGWKRSQEEPATGIERHVRKLAGSVFAREHFIHQMIETIKTVLSDEDEET